MGTARARVLGVIIVLLIVTLIVSAIPLTLADGYGEDSQSLGQIVDTFANADNVSTAYQVINNVTLEVMELNITLGVNHVNENFTDYTTVDINNDLWVSEDRIEFQTFRRDSSGYVYYDYGADYWDDFQVEFTVVINDTEAGDGDQRWINFILSMTNFVGAFNDRPVPHDSLFIAVRDNAATDNTFKLSISGYDGAVLIGETIGKIRAVSVTPMYLRVNRTDDNFYLWVYSDSSYTVLDESLSVLNMGLTDPFQYIYAIQSLDIANDGEIWMSGYIEDLWIGTLGFGYFSSGYFTTEDHLAGINGSVLAQLTNATIPAGTGITAEFSSNNSTWLNPTDLIDGFQSIDLRDLNWSSAHFVRYNFSRADPSDTPRLCQSRLITTEGPTGNGDGNGDTVYIGAGITPIIIICGVIIIPIIIYIVKRR